MKILIFVKFKYILLYTLLYYILIATKYNSTLLGFKNIDAKAQTTKIAY